MENDPEAVEKIILAIYVAVGIPVAWLHMRQQKMTESVRKIPYAQTQSMVIYVLAVLWPLLLFAMALNYLLQKPRRRSGRDSAPAPLDSDSPIPAKPEM